jgi:hypothetical protein
LLLAAGCGYAQSKVDATIGWTWTEADQGNGFAPLHGWYGSLSYNVMPRVGITLEHESYWGQYHQAGANQHVWLLGTTLKLLGGEHKVQPFVQPLLGDTRSNSTGTIHHAFTFQVAGGVDIKLGGPVSLELIPAQYVLEEQAGQTLNSYSAGAGLQFSFGK